MAKSKQTVAQDVREVIMTKMDDEGRQLTWLSDKTGINYNTLYSVLKRRIFDLSQENLNKINEVLQTDFTLPE